jgi:hypothetical protein
MKRIAISCLALVGSLGGTPYSIAADEGREDPTMPLFLQACATPYAHSQLVEPEVRKLGFNELQDDLAKRYLGGAPGKAWAGVFQARRFIIALRPESLCTVIAFDGDASAIKAAVESWLPPPESGVAAQRLPSQAPSGLETTAYELSGGKVRERWVVTVSSDPASQTKAMLSWSRL